MRKFLIIAFYTLLFTCGVNMLSSCSNSDDNEPTEFYQAQAIIGRWEMYLPAKDNSYFYFSKGGTWIWYNGDILQQTTSGTYTFDNKDNVIHCNQKDGYSITINVTFIDTENATFVWNYDVLSKYNTIQVHRTSQQ